jgi:hypothetical protein
MFSRSWVFSGSVQDSCAARLPGSWLLLVRGRVCRSSPRGAFG